MNRQFAIVAVALSVVAVFLSARSQTFTRVEVDGRATRAIRQMRAENRPEIDAESRAYRQWLDSIPGARLVVTHQSGHNVPIEQPELVVETIRQLIQ